VVKVTLMVMGNPWVQKLRRAIVRDARVAKNNPATRMLPYDMPSMLRSSALTPRGCAAGVGISDGHAAPS
jgi:hypothetical protein